MQPWARRLSAQVLFALAAGLCVVRADGAAQNQSARPDDPVSLYNAACNHSRRAELAEAEQLLMQALKAGFSNFSWMQRDPDLIPMRGTHVFQTILRARDAADPILADRMRGEWLDALGSADYHVRVDPERRISYVTALDDEALARIITDVAWRSEYLVNTLFDEPLRHFVLVAMPRPEDRSRLLPDSHVHGSYHHSRRQLLAADGTRSLRHEFVHVLHHNHMDLLGQAHPMWIQEGLACLYESVVIDDAGTVVIRPTERESIARALASRGELLAWETLFTLDDRELLADPGANYAAVRSIFLFLAHRGMIGAWYDAYTERFDFDPTGALAFETTFGLPLASIEAEWRAWIESGHSTHAVVDPSAAKAAIPAGLAGLTGVSPSGALPIPDEDDMGIELLLADGRAQYDAGAYEDAIATLQELLGIMPDHPASRYALGLAYLRLADVDAAREQRRILDGLDRSLGSLLENLTTK